MLEQPSLLLLPWIHALDVTRSSVHQGPRWVRSIVAPATNHPLGFAAWGAGTFAGWLAWLGRKTIQVFESEDESDNAPAPRQKKKMRAKAIAKHR